MSKQGRRHNVIPFTFLQTPVNINKGDPHCMVGYRPDWGGDILFLIPCI